MTKYQFKKPPEINPLDVEYEEAYKRRMQVFSRAHIQADSEFLDIPHTNHAVTRSMTEDKSLIKTYLLGITKTKIPEGRFEDSNGEIIRGPDAPKVGLSVLLYQTIADSKSIAMGNPPEDNPLSTDTWIIGRYSRPRIKIVKDNRGNITDAYPVGSFQCWYLEGNKENIDKVLSNKEYIRHKNFTMSCMDSNGIKRSVFNEEEFKSGQLEDLCDANIGDGKGGSFFTKDRSFGGLNRYLLDKKAKREQGKNKEEDHTIIDIDQVETNNRSKTTTKKSLQPSNNDTA